LAYIPDIGSLVANTTSKLLSPTDSLAAEDVPLFLPSSLSPNLQSTLRFSKILAYEIQLRIAQADDALADIRHYLRIISGLWQFKKVNICYGSPAGIPKSHQEVVLFLTHVFTCTFHHSVSHIVLLPHPFHMSVSFNDVYATILLRTYAGL
jgi:hypothetical protein